MFKFPTFILLTAIICGVVFGEGSWYGSTIPKEVTKNDLNPNKSSKITVFGNEEIPAGKWLCAIKMVFAEIQPIIIQFWSGPSNHDRTLLHQFYFMPSRIGTYLIRPPPDCKLQTSRPSYLGFERYDVSPISGIFDLVNIENGAHEMFHSSEKITRVVRLGDSVRFGLRMRMFKYLISAYMTDEESYCPFKDEAVCGNCNIPPSNVPRFFSDKKIFDPMPFQTCPQNFDIYSFDLCGRSEDLCRIECDMDPKCEVYTVKTGNCHLKSVHCLGSMFMSPGDTLHIARVLQSLEMFSNFGSPQQEATPDPDLKITTSDPVTCISQGDCLYAVGNAPVSGLDKGIEYAGPHITILDHFSLPPGFLCGFEVNIRESETPIRLQIWSWPSNGYSKNERTLVGEIKHIASSTGPQNVTLNPNCAKIQVSEGNHIGFGVGGINPLAHRQSSHPISSFASVLSFPAVGSQMRVKLRKPDFVYSVRAIIHNTFEKCPNYKPSPEPCSIAEEEIIPTTPAPGCTKDGAGKQQCVTYLGNPLRPGHTVQGHYIYILDDFTFDDFAGQYLCGYDAYIINTNNVTLQLWTDFGNSVTGFEEYILVDQINYKPTTLGLQHIPISPLMLDGSERFGLMTMGQSSIGYNFDLTQSKVFYSNIEGPSNYPNVNDFKTIAGASLVYRFSMRAVVGATKEICASGSSLQPIDEPSWKKLDASKPVQLPGSSWLLVGPNLYGSPDSTSLTEATGTRIHIIEGFSMAEAYLCFFKGEFSSTDKLLLQVWRMAGDGGSLKNKRQVYYQMEYSAPSVGINEAKLQIPMKVNSEFRIGFTTTTKNPIRFTVPKNSTDFQFTWFRSLDFNSNVITGFVVDHLALSIVYHFKLAAYLARSPAECDGNVYTSTRPSHTTAEAVPTQETYRSYQHCEGDAYIPNMERVGYKLLTTVTYLAATQGSYAYLLPAIQFKDSAYICGVNAYFTSTDPVKFYVWTQAGAKWNGHDELLSDKHPANQISTVRYKTPVKVSKADKFGFVYEGKSGLSYEMIQTTEETEMHYQETALTQDVAFNKSMLFRRFPVQAIITNDPALCSQIPETCNVIGERGIFFGSDEKGKKTISVSTSTTGECAKSNGGCSHICALTSSGKAVCSCPPGLKLLSDYKNCEDVDECLYGNGGCEQICKHVSSVPQCSCHAGYRMSLNKKACVDFNECKVNHTLCGDSRFCLNTVGSYKCVYHHRHKPIDQMFMQSWAFILLVAFLVVITIALFALFICYVTRVKRKWKPLHSSPYPNRRSHSIRVSPSQTKNADSPKDETHDTSVIRRQMATLEQLDRDLGKRESRKTHAIKEGLTVPKSIQAATASIQGSQTNLKSASIHSGSDGQLDAPLYKGSNVHIQYNTASLHGSNVQLASLPGGSTTNLDAASSASVRGSLPRLNPFNADDASVKTENVAHVGYLNVKDEATII